MFEEEDTIINIQTNPKVQKKINKLLAEDAAQQQRNYQYYQNLMKSDPRGYLDPKVAVQMEKDAQALGDAFGLPEED